MANGVKRIMMTKKSMKRRKRVTKAVAKLVEVVMEHARDNARTMVASGPDETMEGVEATYASATSIIDSLSGPRECTSYGLKKSHHRRAICRVEKPLQRLGRAHSTNAQERC